MCTYLHGPREGGMYYFRRGIPARLRPIIGQREFMFSLGVKDREAAKRLIPRHTAATQRQLDQAQAELDSQIAQPPAIKVGPVIGGYISREQAEWEQEQAEFISRLAAEEDWEAEDAEAYERRLLDPAAKLTGDDVLAARLLQEAQTVAQGLRRRYYRRKRSDDRSAIAPPRAKPAEASGSAVSIVGLFDGYAKQPGIRPETVKQFSAIIRYPVAFLGNDDALAVTPQDLVRWRSSR